MNELTIVPSLDCGGIGPLFESTEDKIRRKMQESPECSTLPKPPEDSYNYDAEIFKTTDEAKLPAVYEEATSTVAGESGLTEEPVLCQTDESYVLRWQVPKSPEVLETFKGIQDANPDEVATMENAPVCDEVALSQPHMRMSVLGNYLEQAVVNYHDLFPFYQGKNLCQFKQGSYVFTIDMRYVNQ